MKLLGILLLLSHPVFAFNYDEFANKNYREIDNTVTIQIIRASYPLDWSTPRGLFLSILKNRYWFPKTKSTLGHVSVEVNCKVANNRVRIFSGQASKDLTQFRTRVLEGYGLSILNTPRMKNSYPLVTVDGRLNTYSEMETQFNLQSKRDNLSIISFKVGQEACVSTYIFIRDYIRKTEQTATAGNRYGFGADPEKFEGAGCAPFVQAVLKRAELYDAEDAMDQTVYAPKKLMGSKKDPVSFMDILMAKNSMKTATINKVALRFPDPELLYVYLVENLEAAKLINKEKLGDQFSWYLLLDKTEKVDNAPPL